MHNSQYILYLLSLSVIIGLVIYMPWNNDPNSEKRHVAKNCPMMELCG